MSRHHKAQGWTSVNQKYRAMFAPLLPLPCPRCPRLVYPDERWHLGHGTDLARGGDVHDLSTMRPEHARCSSRSGGQAAARKRKAQTRMPPPNW